MKKFLAIALCLLAFTGCGSKADVQKDLRLGSYAFEGDIESSSMPTVVLKSNNEFDIIYKGPAINNMTGTYDFNEQNDIVLSATTGDKYVFAINDKNNLVYINISSELATRDNDPVPASAEFIYADDIFSDD